MSQSPLAMKEKKKSNHVVLFIFSSICVDPSQFCHSFMLCFSFIFSSFAYVPVLYLSPSTLFILETGKLIIESMTFFFLFVSLSLSFCWRYLFLVELSIWKVLRVKTNLHETRIASRTRNLELTTKNFVVISSSNWCFCFLWRIFGDHGRSVIC